MWVRIRAWFRRMMKAMRDIYNEQPAPTYRTRSQMIRQVMQQEESDIGPVLESAIRACSAPKAAHYVEFKSGHPIHLYFVFDQGEPKVDSNGHYSVRARRYRSHELMTLMLKDISRIEAYTPPSERRVRARPYNPRSIE
jgi:hypothetical protein